MYTGETRTRRGTKAKALWVVDDGSRDVVVFCPGCKTIETLNLNSEGIAPTRRFTQRDGAVYHACGSEIPCRRYSLSELPRGVDWLISTFVTAFCLLAQGLLLLPGPALMVICLYGIFLMV